MAKDDGSTVSGHLVFGVMIEVVRGHSAQLVAASRMPDFANEA